MIQSNLDYLQESICKFLLARKLAIRAEKAKPKPDFMVYDEIYGEKDKTL
jgi:hypothetical protein